jgi:hypothetical protein
LAPQPVAAGFSLRQHRLETCATRNPLMDGSIFLVPKLLLGNPLEAKLLLCYDRLSE